MLTKQCDIDQVNQCWTWGLYLRLTVNHLLHPQPNGKTNLLISTIRCTINWYYFTNETRVAQTFTLKLSASFHAPHYYARIIINRIINTLAFRSLVTDKTLIRGTTSSQTEQFIVVTEIRLAKGKAFSYTLWLVTPHLNSHLAQITWVCSDISFWWQTYEPFVKSVHFC